MPTPTIPPAVPAIAEHLRELYAERALAELEGLPSDGSYMTRLDHEITGYRNAYVGAAVTEIATLRAALSGSLQG